jgi:hypothetical protein
LEKKSITELDRDKRLFEFRDALKLPSEALRVLGNIKTTRAVELLIRVFQSPVPEFRREAVEALKLIDLSESKDGLRLALDDPDPYVRLEAAGALKEANEKTISILKMAIKGSDSRLRRSAAQTLENIRGKDAQDLVRIALGDKDKNVRWQAAESAKAIGIGGEDVAIAVFEEEFLSSEWARTSLASQSLKEMGTQKALYSLMKGLHSRPGVYHHAASVLGDIARGEFAVLVCDDVLQHWPSFLSSKRNIAYNLLSDLAPEVRAIVGESWPAWRRRIRMRINPPHGFLTRFTIGVLVRLVSVAVLARRITRIISRKSGSHLSSIEHEESASG